MTSSADTGTGSIPRSFIDQLLDHTDLVSLINARVPLKKAGSQYKACCPFHDEKTPSFNVNAQKQFYHCFGCGASGDAIRFLQDYDGLSFVEAVESLAQFNGMTVPRQKMTPQAKEAEKKTRDLYELMLWVAKFYRNQLKTHPQAQHAKDYLRQRGLTPEVAKNFVIGFAPPGWQTLTETFARHLPADQQDHETLVKQLLEAGMMIEKQDEAGAVIKRYDRFRHRIMFPIRDGRGRVIGFGGRVLSDQDQPKYLNSPETVLFHKSQTLYGLFEMRQARQKFERILVVEGYMDVVALAQFGIANSVATLGTAMTADHFQLLFREVNEVVCCFDGDSAGQKAAWKALELALTQMKATRSVRFLFLPEGDDPDSMVRREGVTGFDQRVAKALTLSQFLFQGLEGQLTAPLSTPEGQQQLIALAKPYIAKAPEALPDVLSQQLSEKVQVPVWRLGQIMGVRVAASQQKGAFAGTKNKGDGLSQAPMIPTKALKVHSKVLRLLKILRAYPRLAQGISSDWFAQLQQSQSKEHQFLAEALKTLYAHQYADQALQDWLAPSKRQRVVQLMSHLALPEDKQGIVAEFQYLVQQIFQDLEADSFAVGAKKPMKEWSLEEIAAWQARQKARKQTET